MKKLPFLMAAILLPGCMGNLGYHDMTAAQIKALGKEANVSCVDATTLYGRVRSVFINVDRTVIDKGGIEVAPDCTVKFLNEKQFKPPALPDPKLPALPPLEWGK